MLPAPSLTHTVMQPLHPLTQVIEENKAILRGKYDTAKALGAQVVAAKQDIAGLKARLEQRRMLRAAAAVAAGLPEAEVLQQGDAEEERCRQGMEQVGRLLHSGSVLACSTSGMPADCTCTHNSICLSCCSLATCLHVLGAWCNAGLWAGQACQEAEQPDALRHAGAPVLLPAVDPHLTLPCLRPS
jgi:hypothetical protein